MLRRRFIQNSFFITTGALLAPVLKSFAKTNASIKVVIVGAGIAGLSAAKYLTEKGIEVVVLEGQSRAGGRIHTDRSIDNIPMDLGAGWIHGPDGNNPITPIARQANATTFLTDDESLVVYDNSGKMIPDATVEGEESEYNELFEEIVKQAKDLPSDVSVLEMIRRIAPDKLNDPLWNWMFTSFAEFDLGGLLDKISSKYFDNDEVFPGQDVLFSNGYDEIINQIIKANGLTDKIKYNQNVSEIIYSNQSVKVKTDTGVEYEGQYVIVTVPLGVLKKNKIVFSPVLPSEKSEIINRLEMGSVNKVFLVWDEAFWETDTQYVGYTDEVRGRYCYFLNYRTFSSFNVLVTFGFGQYGFELEKQTDAQIKADIMTNLRKIYGSNTPEPKQILVTRWSQNPYSYGAYSFATIGMKDTDFDDLANPVEKRLLFAGEHTISMYRGTVHGAYLSGKREAERIIEAEQTSRVKKNELLNGEIKIYPNPGSEVHISFNLKKTAQLQFQIFDLKGKKVIEMPAQIMSSGDHTLTIPTHGLDSGNYTLTMLCNGLPEGSQKLFIP